MSSQTNRLSKQSVTSAWMKRSLGRDMYVHVCVVRKRRDEKRREERETEGGREREGEREEQTDIQTDISTLNFLALVSSLTTNTHPGLL